MNRINNLDIKKVLESLKFGIFQTESGSYYTIQTADEDFCQNVRVYYFITDNKWLNVQAAIQRGELSASEKAKHLLFINKYNMEHRMPQAYWDDDGGWIIVEQQYLIDEEVSVDYVRNVCVKFTTQLIWSFFVTYQKAFGKF